MASLLSHVTNLSKRLNSFDDGPHLREQIQFDVKALSTSSQNVKRSLLQLKDQNEPGVDALLERFESLRGRMQEELPPIIQKLRGTQNSSTPIGGSGGPNYTEPILSQTQLDGDSDLLDVLEQQVNEILAAMREVHLLFGKTLQELQKQRHILVQIEGETSKAVEEMEVGNEELRKAQGRQRSSTKCICWIVVIAILVVAAVVLIILWKFKWSTPSATPAEALFLGFHS
jgi:hypothetical protein